MKLVERLEEIDELVAKLANEADGLIEAEIVEALHEMATASWKPEMLSDGAGGLTIIAYCKDYEDICMDKGGFMEVGSFTDLIEYEAERAIEGDYTWGERVRAGMIDAVKRLDAAIEEGKRRQAEWENLNRT